MPTTEQNAPASAARGVDVSRSLNQEIEAAKNLRLQIAAMIEHGATPEELSPDDLQILQDTFEGETNLEEQIDLALSDIDEHEALVEGLDSKIKAFQARKARFEKRVNAVRGLIEAAMIGAGWEKKRFATATITIGKRAASVEVVDEASIPSVYFKRPDPTLSKSDLGKALKEADKAIEAGLKQKNTGAKAAAILDVLLGLPSDPARDEALKEARAVNDPDEQMKLLQSILERFPLIPGAKLNKGGVSLKIARS